MCLSLSTSEQLCQVIRNINVKNDGAVKSKITTREKEDCENDQQLHRQKKIIAQEMSCLLAHNPKASHMVLNNLQKTYFTS